MKNVKKKATSFQAIATQLEILEWRDAQLMAVSKQLEKTFPILLGTLDRQVDDASLIDLGYSTVDLKESIGTHIQNWSAEQLEVAMKRAEVELNKTITKLPDSVNFDSDVWEQVTSALPALAGVGLIGASFAAIPAVISFATISTSVLFFWASASISLPLLAVGVTAIGVAAATGAKSLELSEKWAREKLRNRIHREAERQVFSIGQKPDARCILSDIQAVIIQAGVNRIEGMK